MASNTESQLLQLCTDGDLFTLKDLITKQGLNRNEVKDPSGLTLLHLACQYGHLDIVQYLIKDQKCNPETTMPNGRTPLHIACKSGHLHIVKCLITEHKCKPHCTDNDGYTPLHAASESGNIETVKYLITEQGCDPQVSDSIGNTPLHYASESGHLHIVQDLITNFNCDPQKTNSRGSIPLHFACRGGQIAVARYFIDEHQCSPNCTNNPQIVNNDGLTPLHFASLNGYLDMTKYLISDCNCNPQCSTNKGNTPLDFACQNGHLEVAKYLITEHKCSPEHGDVNGYTPLHSAAHNGHLTVVKYLISELGCNAQIANSNGNTPLHFACLNGHLDVTKYLISDCNCNPQCSDKNGNTPLHCASENGYLEVAKYLITEHKCSPEHGNVNGYTPLHSAASNGHLAVVKYLICELGDNPQVADKNGTSPLHCACQNGHLDVTKYLISDCNCNPQCSTNVSKVPLHCACQEGHLEIAKYLTTQNKCSPEHSSVDGLTPLHSAAFTGHLAVVKYLISECGCNPQIADNNGITPLHCACLNGHLDITKYLISDCNCNPQCSVNSGDTPLHYACEKGHLEVAKYLITRHKCSPELGNVNGCTPLHLAASNGHLAVVKYLISEIGCNPQIVDNDGLTPLHFACLNGHLDITKYLISDCNCNPQCSTNCGNTPLHCACQNGHLEVAKYLITEHKCSPEHGNVNGYTPLHSAAIIGHLAVVKYLISELGCNPQIAVNNGITPLFLACQNGHLDITKYLVSDCNCNPQCSAYGITPLYCACYYGHLEVAKYLISEHKFSPEHGNVNGFTPLHSANHYGHLAPTISEPSCIAQIADNHGHTLLHFACENGHLEVAKYLITEHKCSPEHGNFGGYTPLHSAASNGHLAIMKYLIIEFGCSPQCSVNSGDTPLHFACQDGHLEVAKYLTSEHKKCSTERSIANRSALLDCHLVVVKYLIRELGYNPLIARYNDFSFLYYSCLNGDFAARKHLILGCNCDSQCTNKDGNTPLHYACLNGHLDIIEYLISDCNCNPHCSANDGCTPLHCACQNGDLIVAKTLITKHKCNPQCTDKEGQTPFHHACASGQVEVVQYFHSENLSDLIHTAHSGDTPLHFACKYNQVEVVQYLLSTGKCDPLIKNAEGQTPVEFATSLELRKLLDHFCKGKYSLESVVKVFVLGDPMAGKSSLVQAIQSNTGFLNSLIGRFKKVKVRKQTAGIDSFTFCSSDFGNVVIYDLAGQREFFTSHAAFLQNLSSCTPGIFILVTNIAQSMDNIYQSLQYWVSFIEESYAHMTKPFIIFVGSHADQLDKGDVQQAHTLIQSCLFEHSENSDQLYKPERVVCLDCTCPSSSGLQCLCSNLKESCNSIRKKKEKIDQRCYVLHKFVHKKYIIKMGVHGSKLKHISKDLEGNRYLLPSNSVQLLPLFQTLHDKGQIILVRNDQDIGESWIIINVAAILETVVGSIFAPRDFPQHIAPGSTGIVPKSRMREAFPDLNTDMVIGFLEHFEFCHQVQPDWIKLPEQVNSLEQLTHDIYYLFPALVTLEKPLLERHGSSYCCGWLMDSKTNHQFLATRFLHVLLLRLAFLFALPQDNAAPTASEVESPTLKRSCTMWKSGITWHDTNGVSTYFEVKDFKTVILIMSSIKDSEIHCVRLRTQLIKTILKAKKEFCPRVNVEEYIMQVENQKSLKALVKYPLQSFKCSLKYISDRISTRDAKDRQDLLLVNPDGGLGKPISELLYFEPYTLLTSDLITHMFSDENSTLILSDVFLSELAGRFYPCNNILSQILVPQPRLLSEKLKMDVHSLDSLDDMSKQLRCVHILETWMEQQDSPATYRRLRKELNKYSIYCGRNPLDLIGGKGKLIDPDSLQRQLYSSDESGDSGEDEKEDDKGSDDRENDDQAARPTLIESVRFRGRERRINIPQEIGIKYHDFGLFLLEDDKGTRIQSLAHKHMNDAEQINMEVLRQWITGRGKQPVTWKTLTAVLRDIDLSALAGEIEAVKCCECTEEKNIPSDYPVQKCLEYMPAEDSEQRNHRGMHDLPARDTKDQSSSTLHGVSEDPPVQRSLRYIITEMANNSEERNIGNKAANDIDDEKYYEAVTQIADIVCRCIQQLQKNQKGHPR